MDKQILVHINLFSLDQQIMIIDENGGMKNFASVDISHLPEVIVEATTAYGANTVKLVGNKNYAEALRNEINEYAIQNYSNKNLNITIMEA